MANYEKMDNDALEAQLWALDGDIAAIREQKRTIRAVLDGRRNAESAERILDTLSPGQVDAIVQAQAARMSAAAQTGEARQ